MNKIRKNDGNLFAPLKTPVFRRVWLSSILSNFGQQILAVTAAWSMVQMNSGAGMIALVQSAIMLPVMILALPAGAIADMYDKRITAILALCLAVIAAVGLAIISYLNLLTPSFLLIGCLLLGTGVALYSPAWQSSVGELVERDVLPSAVVLYGVSSNIARSVGPAIGGILLASSVLYLPFAITAILYIPIIAALISWRKKQNVSMLPREGIFRAIRSGVRYIRFSIPMRYLVFRSAVAGVGAAAVYALLPVVTSQRLNMGPEAYGLLLGAFGLGAIFSIALVPKLRSKFSPRAQMTVLSIGMGVSVALTGVSGHILTTALAAFCAGGCWLLTTTMLNSTLQNSVPRWVVGRALATFHAALAGGIAIGAWLWGGLAEMIGIELTMVVAGVTVLSSCLLEYFWPMPRRYNSDIDSLPSHVDPTVNINILGISGPILIIVEQEVPVENAKSFYELALKTQTIMERNGAHQAVILRDIENPRLWTRHWQYPTWNDYLRARDRPTQTERNLTKQMSKLIDSEAGITVHRQLVCPVGSGSMGSAIESAKDRKFTSADPYTS